jgi:hypothetical protein
VAPCSVPMRATTAATETASKPSRSRLGGLAVVLGVRACGGLACARPPFRAFPVVLASPAVVESARPSIPPGRSLVRLAAPLPFPGSHGPRVRSATRSRPKAVGRRADATARLVCAPPVSPTGARWRAAPAPRERLHAASNHGGRRPVLCVRGLRSAAVASTASGWGGVRLTDLTDERAVLASSRAKRARAQESCALLAESKGEAATPVPDPASTAGSEATEERSRPKGASAASRSRTA